jgi:cytochrome c553
VRRALALAIASSCTLALAAEMPPGPAKTQTCATCHGPKGISVAPDAPNLAGQPQIYLAAQLQAFRDGRRLHPVMNLIAKGLSDQDIEQLSQWYSSIAIEARGAR